MERTNATHNHDETRANLEVALNNKNKTKKPTVVPPPAVKGGGANAKDALAKGGIDATKRDLLWVYPEDLFIVRDKTHPLYDERLEEPLEPGFAEDVAERGVQQVITVRKNGVTTEGKQILEVVDGRQRTQAAILANTTRDEKMKVPIVMKKFATDLEMIEYAASLNVQRKDESYYTLACKALRMRNFGSSDARICRVLKIQPTSLKQHLEYLDLSPEARKAFDAKTFPMMSVDVIASIPREEQPKVVAEVIALGATKSHEIPAAVDAVRQRRPYKAPERKKMWSRNQIEAWAQSLERCEGRAVLLTILGYDEDLEKYPHLVPKED